MPLSEKAKEILKTVAAATVEAKADVIAKRGGGPGDPAAIQKVNDEIEKMRKANKDSAQKIHDHAAALGAEGHGSADDDADDDTEKIFKALGIDPVAAGLKKAGMRHSKADKEHIDAIHKASKDMGADCDMKKSAEASEIQKMNHKLDTLVQGFGAAIQKLGNAPVGTDVATRLVLVPKENDGQGGNVKKVDAPKIPDRVDAANPADFKIIDQSLVQKFNDPRQGIPLHEYL